ncbi:TPA: hypothetical protein DCZ36_01465 [Candidatus Gracilibacteria bacterium]|nr:hypothetical protein [Candidatus Gracilibacteria bacterium]
MKNKSYFDQLEIAQQAIETTRIALVSEVEEEANIINNTMKARASTTLESSETMSPKKVRNLEEPPKESGIAIVIETRKLSDTVPECAERNGIWFYNRPAVDRLIEMRVLCIPTEKQLLTYISTLPGSVITKARVMSGKDELFPGFLNADFGVLCERGEGVVWWVASGYCVYLNYGGRIVRSGSTDFPRNGYLIPVFVDEN